MVNHQNLVIVSCWVIITLISKAIAEPLGILLRNVDKASETVRELQLNNQSLWMGEEGIENIRLVPGEYPEGMEYHFDGLACLVKFEFTKEGTLKYFSKFFESNLYKHYNQCMYVGSGTTKVGFRPCLANPVVNILPIDQQLWLTIDTATWGRVDYETLETIQAANAKVESVVLNAHPACDPKTNECFVQYTCGSKKNPLTNQACVGLLVTSDSLPDIEAVEISRATLPENRLIQHSHSPCVTENFLISKLDSFEYKGFDTNHGGVLKTLQQKEDNLWLVMDRNTKESTILKSENKFVNNHFWNCYEHVNEENGKNEIVIDTVAATSAYLDTYYKDNLMTGPKWDKMFFRPLRCAINTETYTNKDSEVECTELLKDKSTIFDYPTFNPLYKMNPDYKYYYAIAPKDLSSSKLFERIIKFDAKSGDILLEWSAPDIYVMEADFVPRPKSVEEDDGILISLLYNATADATSLGLFDAISMKLVDMYPLENVIAFGAHGISKFQGKYWPNP